MFKTISLLLSLFILTNLSAQEYITNTSLKYYSKVKKVKILDSLNNDIETYVFDNNGFLTSTKLKAERFEKWKKINYKKSKIVKVNTFFRYKYGKTSTSKIFEYVGDNISRLKTEIDSNDKTIGDFSNFITKIYKYDKQKHLIQTSEISNLGTIEEFFYSDSDLIREKIVKELDNNFIEKEFKNDTLITVDSYSATGELTSREFKTYDRKNKLIQVSRIGYIEKVPVVMATEKYTYENDTLVNAKYIYMDSGSEDIYYNKRGDIIKYRKWDVVSNYSYTYNNHGDIVEKRLYLADKLFNIWRYTYEYF
ncbi:hypothetical protein [Flavobacterium sp. NRK1]|uniref:hypothetical protein n=1 Tax=Flavobacterium sp. NRK1 TaxID=2954929 RepID=UPI0020926F78|nr:hypothetical protein [Flavobacterium sp. NRK1]MCO6149503.1 hypothetical protein [Flavobacterium sp. NRK1]